MSVQQQMMSETPSDESDDELVRKFVFRIRKLRWMGMEDAARSLELELRNAPYASSPTLTPR